MWSRFLKANGLYAIGSAANTAALFLLVPYLVNRLTPREYGAWSLYEVAILLLNTLMLAGLDSGLMREYWFLDGEAKRAQLAGTILLAIALWGAVLLALGALLLSAGWEVSLPGSANGFVLVLGISWTEAVFAFSLTLFRIREQATVFVVLSLGRMLLFMEMAIALVHAGHGLLGALAGRLGATVFMFGVAIALGHRLISLTLDLSALKRVIRYGLPLLPANLASYVLFASDRYALQHFSTLETVAIYTFAYKVAGILDVLINRPFALDWAPRRFKIATQTNAPQRYSQILVMYLWAAVACALVILALAPLAYAWIAPPPYGAGIQIVPVILLAYLLYGLSYPLNVGIMLRDRTQYLPVIGWGAAGVCLGLNIWWIPRFGMLGAAWATVVSYGLWTAGITYASMRLYPVSYAFERIGLVLGAGLLAYFGIWILQKTLPATEGLAIALRTFWAMAAMCACGWKIWNDYRLERRREAQNASPS